jgi:hypothetical protein
MKHIFEAKEFLPSLLFIIFHRKRKCSDFLCWLSSEILFFFFFFGSGENNEMHFKAGWLADCLGKV